MKLVQLVKHASSNLFLSFLYAVNIQQISNKSAGAVQDVDLLSVEVFAQCISQSIMYLLLGSYYLIDAIDVIPRAIKLRYHQS